MAKKEIKTKIFIAQLWVFDNDETGEGGANIDDMVKVLAKNENEAESKAKKYFKKSFKESYNEGLDEEDTQITIVSYEDLKTI